MKQSINKMQDKYVLRKAKKHSVHKPMGKLTIIAMKEKQGIYES